MENDFYYIKCIFVKIFGKCCVVLFNFIKRKIERRSFCNIDGL